MTNRTASTLLVFVLAAGLAGCGGAPAPGPTAPAPLPPLETPPQPPPPAFHEADVTVSGVVSEMTPSGLRPIDGALVANGEGWVGYTDANGFFSFRGVWFCPCAAEPRVDAGVTSVWVGKAGYEDPEGQSPTRFSSFSGSGYRDVLISGDTHIELQLVRR